MRNGKVGDVSRTERDMASFSKYYLILYNTVQTAGWSYILFQALKYIIKYRTLIGVWKICNTSVIIFQSFAILEVLHSAVRLVPANPFVTLLQVFSRLMQLWGIMMPLEKVQNSPTLATTVIAWSISEIIRYSYYCAQLLDKPSKTHTWCRYSFFYVLYPMGVSGELINTYLALDEIKKRQLYSILLPNRLNISFSYYYFNILIMLSYIPFFPQLFFHMVRQRKKMLNPEPKKGK